MPSDRKQINVRVDDAVSTRFEELVAAMSAEMGTSVSQALVISVAITELHRKKTGKSSPPPAPPRRGRPPATD